MTRQDAEATLARYFAAFNAGDTNAMLAEVTEDISHHVNEGKVRVGKTLFAAFCAHMEHCYKEALADIVIMASEDGTRAAAEFTVHGTYLHTDGDLPAARGQHYVLPAGSFMTLRDGKIARVTTYYNLADWVRQVSV